MDVLPEPYKQPLVELLLSVADDKFMLGHRNADWTGLAPMIEEDIAFSSLAQDELAHASALYQMVAGLVSGDADRLAFGRKPEEYRCAEIVELSDEFNWATALARKFFCDHFDAIRLARMGQSSYKPLAQLAQRLAAEEQIHIDHVDDWLRRLGTGSPDARDRIQTALDYLAPLAASLFEPPTGIGELEQSGIYPASEPDSFERWWSDLQSVSGEATLTLRVRRPATFPPGGRRGRHSPAFAALIDELTEVYRQEPEAAW